MKSDVEIGIQLKDNDKILLNSNFLDKNPIKFDPFSIDFDPFLFRRLEKMTLLSIKRSKMIEIDQISPNILIF